MKPQNLLFSALFILLLGEFSVFACVNLVGHLADGTERIQIEDKSVADFMKNFVDHEDRAYWEDVRAQSQPRHQTKYPVIHDSNNLAVALIHLGQIKEAIEILEGIEKRFPGRYFTAANLGTAYELNGENQKALDWIKRGIKRKKESHFGTEWLHVKILETKLAMEKEPDWLKRNSVLGVDLHSAQSQEQVKLPTDHLGKQKSLREVEEALVYQLHERLQFVKPTEPMVAQLLLDLSKVFTFLRTSEHAAAVKDLAVTYESGSKEVKDQTKVVEPENKASGNYLWGGFIALIAALILGGIYAVIRKRKML